MVTGGDVENAVICGVRVGGKSRGISGNVVLQMSWCVSAHVCVVSSFSRVRALDSLAQKDCGVEPGSWGRCLPLIRQFFGKTRVKGPGCFPAPQLKKALGLPWLQYPTDPA